MAYSAEVVKRARARLAQAKADRESENREHLATAYEKVPRIRQIDQQLRQTMALAAQAVFAQGGDAQAVMEKAKQDNLALQQERAALVAAHFEEGYLDESPICDCCGGSGYLGTQMCECLTELCRQEQRRDLALLSGGNENFQRFRLDYYSDQYDPNYGTSPRALMEKHLRTCRTYAATFALNSGNLLFNGGTGLGKTFLSACIAKTVTDRGYDVVYESAGNLFGKLEQARFSPNETLLQETQRFRSCDLLIIDDLGTELTSQFVTAAFYSLLNDRLQRGLPMIVSTNMNVDELARRYSPQIASRLHGHFQHLIFLGQDIRVMKNRGL